MKWYLRYILVCILFGSAPEVAAQSLTPVVVLDTGRSEQNVLGREIEYLEDASQALTLDSVLSAEYTRRFMPIRGLYPNFSYTSSAYWLKFRVVVRNTPQQGKWLIAAYYPSLDFLDVYVVLSSGNLAITRCGARVAWQQKILPHRHHLAPLPITEANETVTVFIRVQSRMTLAVPLEIISERRFADNERSEMIPMWMYYGIAIAMAIYNLFLFIALRDRAYLYYVAYVVLYSSFIFVSVNGLVFQIFPAYARLVPVLVTIFSLLGNIFGLLFAKEFLHLKEFGRWSVRWGWVLIGTCLLGLGVQWFVPISPMHRALNLIAVLVIVFMITNAVLAIRRGFRPAAFFLAAWTMFFLGALVFILSNFAILPKTPLVQFSIQIGSALEMLLLSFALGDRIAVLRKEQERARAEALQGEMYRLRNIELAEANEEIARQKEVLEEQARDIEIVNATLHEQNERLMELDNEKNEFLGIAAHDLKNPLSAMRGITEVLIMDNERMGASDRAVFLRQTLLTIDRMIELVRNLLDINAIERGGITLSPLRVDFTALVRDVLAEYRYHAEEKSLTLVFDETTHIIGRADTKALRQIVDNLISNALKYSPKGKRVMARLSQHETSEFMAVDQRDILARPKRVAVVRLEIQDEGEGISEQDMKRLFGKFARLSARPTGGEHSTGLGLSIVKRLVEAMGGRVWCESELGRGATFIVEMPA
jgi:signal transduction histidine kinase